MRIRDRAGKSRESGGEAGGERGPAGTCRRGSGVSGCCGAISCPDRSPLESSSRAEIGAAGPSLNSRGSCRQTRRRRAPHVPAKNAEKDATRILTRYSRADKGDGGALVSHSRPNVDDVAAARTRNRARIAAQLKARPRATCPGPVNLGFDAAASDQMNIYGVSGAARVAERKALSPAPDREETETVGGAASVRPTRIIQPTATGFVRVRDSLQNYSLMSGRSREGAAQVRRARVRAVFPGPPPVAVAFSSPPLRGRPREGPPGKRHK